MRSHLMRDFTEIANSIKRRIFGNVIELVNEINSISANSQVKADINSESLIRTVKANGSIKAMDRNFLMAGVAVWGGLEFLLRLFRAINAKGNYNVLDVAHFLSTAFAVADGLEILVKPIGLKWKSFKRNTEAYIWLRKRADSSPTARLNRQAFLAPEEQTALRRLRYFEDELNFISKNYKKNKKFSKISTFGKELEQNLSTEIKEELTKLFGEDSKDEISGFLESRSTSQASEENDSSDSEIVKYLKDRSNCAENETLPEAHSESKNRTEAYKKFVLTCRGFDLIRPLIPETCSKEERFILNKIEELQKTIFEKESEKTRSDIVRKIEDIKAILSTEEKVNSLLKLISEVDQKIDEGLCARRSCGKHWKRQIISLLEQIDQPKFQELLKEKKSEENGKAEEKKKKKQQQLYQNFKEDLDTLDEYESGFDSSEIEKIKVLMSIRKSAEESYGQKELSDRGYTSLNSDIEERISKIVLEKRGELSQGLSDKLSINSINEASEMLKLLEPFKQSIPAVNDFVKVIKNFNQSNENMVQNFCSSPSSYGNLLLEKEE